MHLGGGGIARVASIDHEDRALGSGQHHRRGQAGGPTADDQDVIFAHVHQGGPPSRFRQQTLRFLGNLPDHGAMKDSEAVISAALDQVGPRLKRLRTQRGVTLTSLAATTGISKSTLSRLETGHRRPSLEVLLPLAAAYHVPLDDLVGAPEVGDPRIRLKPKRVNGRTVIPLTRQPGGMQAWKMLIPKSKSVPELRTHDGYEWLYVIAGRLRLVLGEHDLVLGPGEVAEFDTRTPHWFGSTGAEAAEVLSLFGRHGERMHVRTKDAVKDAE